MYAKYAYLNTSTIEQIHDDIFEIFCGETNLANLSASCDVVNSEIITTYSTSPWADFDDVSTSERIMRMEVDDAPGTYKYVGWHHDGTDDVGFALMESWDAVANIPTNEVVVNYDKQGMRTYPTSGGIMHIYSSQYCTIIMEQDTLSNVWGGQSRDPTYGSLGIFECSRDNPSLAVGDMPNWFISSTAMFWGDGDDTMRATFWKGRDYANIVQTPFTAEMAYPARDNQYSDSTSYPVTGGLGTSTALEEIGALTTFGLEPIMVGSSPSKTAYQATTFYGNVSSRCDIWLMPVGSEACGKLIDLDNRPYIVFKAGYTGSSTGANFGGKFIVPYG